MTDVKKNYSSNQHQGNTRRSHGQHSVVQENAFNQQNLGHQGFGQNATASAASYKQQSSQPSQQVSRWCFDKLLLYFLLLTIAIPVVQLGCHGCIACGMDRTSRPVEWKYLLRQSVNWRGNMGKTAGDATISGWHCTRGSTSAAANCSSTNFTGPGKRSYERRTAVHSISSSIQVWRWIRIFCITPRAWKPVWKRWHK